MTAHAVTAKPCSKNDTSPLRGAGATSEPQVQIRAGGPQRGLDYFSLVRFRREKERSFNILIASRPSFGQDLRSSAEGLKCFMWSCLASSTAVFVADVCSHPQEHLAVHIRRRRDGGRRVTLWPRLFVREFLQRLPAVSRTRGRPFFLPPAMRAVRHPSPEGGGGDIGSPTCRYARGLLATASWY